MPGAATYTLSHRAAHPKVSLYEHNTRFYGAIRGGDSGYYGSSRDGNCLASACNDPVTLSS